MKTLLPGTGFAGWKSNAVSWKRVDVEPQLEIVAAATERTDRRRNIRFSFCMMAVLDVGYNYWPRSVAHNSACSPTQHDITIMVQCQHHIKEGIIGDRYWTEFPQSIQGFRTKEIIGLLEMRLASQKACQDKNLTFMPVRQQKLEGDILRAKPTV
jgi:hypothetical protein